MHSIFILLGMSCFLCAAVEHVGCGTDFKLRDVEKRNSQYSCSPVSTCSAVCDNPEWRNAYSDALDAGILEDLVINSVVHTWAPPPGQTGSPYTTENATRFQLEYVNQHFASTGISFNFTHNEVPSRWWNARVSSYWNNCYGDSIADNARDDDCIDAAWDGGSLICNANESAIFCASCTINSSCLSTPLTDECLDALIAIATCPCVCFSSNPSVPLADPTQHDGLSCKSSSRGNGVCNVECNFLAYDWDDGDCCTPNGIQGPCFDPSSPYRDWSGLPELKSAFNNTPTDHINQFVTKFHSTYWPIAGVATFPWDAASRTPTGGIMINPDHAWGPTAPYYNKFVATHEMGHALGLWHTHHGTTETLGCGDPCYEHQPANETSFSSDYTGDLCSDTMPTPLIRNCSDPATTALSCNNRTWVNTPYANFMSYTMWSCNDLSFTRQQRGRMRCYLDCALHDWRASHQRAKSNTIVRSPTVTVYDSPGIRVTWMAPLGYLDESDYLIERDPAFVSTTFSQSSTTTYVDMDFEDESFRSGVVKYRVKKLSAEFWSPWSAGSIAYIPGIDPLSPVAPPPVNPPGATLPPSNSIPVVGGPEPADSQSAARPTLATLVTGVVIFLYL